MVVVGGRDVDNVVINCRRFTLRSLRPPRIIFFLDRLIIRF